MSAVAVRGVSHHRPVTAVTRRSSAAARRTVLLSATASAGAKPHADNKPVSLSLALQRRDLLLGGACAAALMAPPAALADDELVQFYGAANPPATYGGVGGTTKDKARYGARSYPAPALASDDDCC